MRLLEQLLLDLLVDDLGNLVDQIFRNAVVKRVSGELHGRLAHDRVMGRLLLDLGGVDRGRLGILHIGDVVV